MIVHAHAHENRPRLECLSDTLVCTKCKNTMNSICFICEVQRTHLYNLSLLGTSMYGLSLIQIWLPKILTSMFKLFDFSWNYYLLKFKITRIILLGKSYQLVIAFGRTIIWFRREVVHSLHALKHKNFVRLLLDRIKFYCRFLSTKKIWQ